MGKKSDKNLIVALDIGTTKVVALVGEVAADGMLEIIGVGFQPSRGLKRGVVVNIEATVQSIQRAVEEAELMAGCVINYAYAGIAGSHIHGLNSHGIVAIRDRQVAEIDIQRVIDAAKAIAIPADKEILHILPQEYIIDNQEGIREPVGMSGVRLEARVHIVTGAVTAAQNVVKCVQRCGLEVGDIILEQLASSHSVLTDDEKELGVCMVDIGGGTTDIAIFTDGAIRHTAVIPIAGDQVTNDIAIALRTPTHNAEEIKKQYASALMSRTSPDDTIEIPAGVARRQPKLLSKKALSAVVCARYEELFALIQAEIKRSGLQDYLASGVVLTGGASQIDGVLELAEAVFQIPVRLGLPQHVRGVKDVLQNPMYSTGVGLLLYGLQQRNEGNTEVVLGEGVKGLWARMKTWFQGNF